MRNEIIHGDCVEWLNKQTKPFVDLIFADPPFNIGYKYDVYDDRKKYREYRAWTIQWMKACYAVLKVAGSFWIAIGDEYAAEVRMIAQRLGLNLRNWVIWHYTFGQNTKTKFARSHTHLFYFTKSKENFTFNTESIVVVSDRLKEYKDKRAGELGRVPFDVWTEFPRVCGTFSERERWHPCQMPEGVLSRIIRACSNIGDLVLDPFAGSGTTLVVAKKLRRDYLGIELSDNYVDGIRNRLQRTEQAIGSGGRKNHWSSVYKELLASLYVENSVPTEQLRKIPDLWFTFVQQFNSRLESIGVDEYSSDQIWDQLENMRKAGKLGRVRVHAPLDTKGIHPAPLFDKETKQARKVNNNP